MVLVVESGVEFIVGGGGSGECSRLVVRSGMVVEAEGQGGWAVAMRGHSFEAATEGRLRCW